MAYYFHTCRLVRSCSAFHFKFTTTTFVRAEIVNRVIQRMKDIVFGFILVVITKIFLINGYRNIEAETKFIFYGPKCVDSVIVI